MAISCSHQCAVSTCIPCQQLQLLQNEVDAAQETLKTAEVALRDAKRRRAPHMESMNMRTAAVTKLPPEILHIVFDIYMKFPQHDLGPSEYSAYPYYERPRWFRAVRRGAPLLFGAISQQWRTAAWSYAKLWETIVAPLSCPGHEYGPQMVSQWLQRSDDRLLSIQIYDPRKTSDNTYDRGSVEKARIQENAKAIIHALNRHASRWYILDFSETPSDILDNLDDGNCFDVSQLRHLCLPAYGLDNMKPLLRMSKSVHRLTHLNLLSFIFPQNINIDWTNLTHLFAEGMSREELFELLKSTAAQLTHLSIRKINAYDLGNAFWALDTPLYFPALVSLTMHQYDTEHTNARLLLHSIVAPALRAFSYDGADSDVTFPTTQILQLISQSNCRITELELLRTGLSDEDLEDFLRSIHTVEHLKIRLDSDHDSQSFLSCLSAEGLETESQPFLPALRRLDINAYWPSPSWDPFVEMYDSIQPGDIPARVNMEVKYTVRYRSSYGPHGFMNRDSLMDRPSLVALVFLWRSYGITCAFNLEDDGSSGDHCIKPQDEWNFLLRSFSFGPSLGSMVSDLEYQAIYDDVVAMSELQL